jgi:hypothetical protein
MALNIDESRRHYEALRIYARSSRDAIEKSRGRDAGDAIAADAEVTVEPGGARPIHDAAAENQDIETVRRFRRPAAGQ